MLHFRGYNISCGIWSSASYVINYVRRTWKCDSKCTLNVYCTRSREQCVMMWKWIIFKCENSKKQTIYINVSYISINCLNIYKPPHFRWHTLYAANLLKSCKSLYSFVWKVQRSHLALLLLLFLLLLLLPSCSSLSPSFSSLIHLLTSVRFKNRLSMSL